MCLLGCRYQNKVLFECISQQAGMNLDYNDNVVNGQRFWYLFGFLLGLAKMLNFKLKFSTPSWRPHVVKVAWSALARWRGIVPLHKSPQQLHNFFSKLLNKVRSTEDEVVPLFRIEPHIEQVLLQLRPLGGEHVDRTLRHILPRSVRPVAIATVEVGRGWSYIIFSAN